MNIAIDLRRKYKIKTPDSLIAATAIYLDQPLVTGDADMINIEGIDVIQL